MKVVQTLVAHIPEVTPERIAIQGVKEMKEHLTGPLYMPFLGNPRA